MHIDSATRNAAAFLLGVPFVTWGILLLVASSASDSKSGCPTSSRQYPAVSGSLLLLCGVAVTVSLTDCCSKAAKNFASLVHSISSISVFVYSIVVSASARCSVQSGVFGMTVDTWAFVTIFFVVFILSLFPFAVATLSFVALILSYIARCLYALACCGSMVTEEVDEARLELRSQPSGRRDVGRLANAL